MQAFIMPSNRYGEASLFEVSRRSLASVGLESLVWPAARNHLGFRIEIHAIFAQRVQVAEE
jgi:hypothetical protein